MVFSSVLFLWFFLPITLAVYYGVALIPIRSQNMKQRIKNAVLLLASIVFYGLGGIKYLLLLLGVLVVNYFGGLAVNSFRNNFSRKFFLILTVVADLGALFCFKYLNLFVLIYENIIAGLPVSEGWSNIVTLTRTGSLSYVDIILPIGISFYIFQSISYVADIYRKEANVQKNFFDFSLYVSFFPQLIAGPIVKYSDIDEQIRTRKESISIFEEGVTRFIFGLSKKVLIANSVAEVADNIWKLDIKGLGAGVTWLAAICYTLQIYYDFSGYSDMAIGLGKMFGFEFKENFNYPYTAVSIQEFWRRWHISLSTWFKEYVYIPLGGSRCSTAKILRNIFIVFLLTGIWHGANFTFLLWGLMYAILLIIERLFLGKLLKKNPAKPINWIYSMFFVIFGWVLFRSDNILQAGSFISEMFSKGNSEYTILSFLSMRGLIAIVLGIVLAFPIYPKIRKLILGGNRIVVNIVKFIQTIVLIALLAYCIVVVVSGSYNPFIYFQF